MALTTACPFLAVRRHWAEVERELRSLALAGQEIEVFYFRLMLDWFLRFIIVAGSGVLAANADSADCVLVIVLQIITYHLMFEECNLCVAAFTHSLKSHTSNILSDGEPPAPLPAMRFASCLYPPSFVCSPASRMLRCLATCSLRFTSSLAAQL